MESHDAMASATVFVQLVRAHLLGQHCFCHSIQSNQTIVQFPNNALANSMKLSCQISRQIGLGPIYIWFMNNLQCMFSTTYHKRGGEINGYNATTRSNTHIMYLNITHLHKLNYIYACVCVCTLVMQLVHLLILECCHILYHQLVCQHLCTTHRGLYWSSRTVKVLLFDYEPSSCCNSKASIKWQK